jgi:hypothetical protein
MSQQVRVEREITFVGDANQEANISGNFLTKRACRVDWFDQAALDATNNYVQTLGGTSDAGAVVGAGEIGFKGTTGTSDNEISFLSTALIFDPSQNPAIEAKIEVTDAVNSFFFFGFSDATSETTPDATIDASGGTIAAAATDAAGFFMDGDKSSTLYYGSIATGGSVASTSTGLTWASGTAKTLRVELDSSLTARYYVNGVQVGTKALAVTDIAAGFCATFNYGTREAAANYLYMRYLAKFQDIP